MIKSETKHGKVAVSMDGTGKTIVKEYMVMTEAMMNFFKDELNIPFDKAVNFITTAVALAITKSEVNDNLESSTKIMMSEKLFEILNAKNKEGEE